MTTLIEMSSQIQRGEVWMRVRGKRSVGNGLFWGNSQVTVILKQSDFVSSKGMWKDVCYEPGRMQAAMAKLMIEG